MALLLHYTGQDYVSRGLLKTELIPGSTSAIVGGCKTGKGFSFDGTVDSAISSSIIVNDSINQSFSFWFRFTGAAEEQTILSLQGSATGTNNTRLLIRRMPSNLLGVGQRIVPSQTYRQTTSPIAFAVDTWHYATFVLKELEGKIDVYINGVYLFSHTWSGTLATSNQRFVWGKRALDNNTGPFQGSICNFKYYNHALSQKEINDDYKSLMLHYKLDKPIATQVFDHSGFNRHIQVIENTTTNSITEKRVYGGSLENNGANVCYGNCSLSDLHGIKEISISFFKLSAAVDVVFCNRSTLPGGIRIQTGVSNFLVDLGGRTDHVSIPLNTYQWYHVCISQNETSQLLYVDGVLRSTKPATTITTTSTITSLSHSNTNGGSFGTYLNGNVQDIRFYAKALTQEDVTELYQTRQEIDNLANGYCYELVEGQSEVEMKANGQLYCDEVVENEDGTFEIVQNKTIKTKEIKEI